MINTSTVPSGWLVKPIAEVLDFRSGSVDPRNTPEELFALFSMPAYDSGGEPEITAGKLIGSSKKQVFSGDVLFARLNPRIPRVWIVNDSTKDSYRKLASTDFLVLVDRKRSDGNLWFEPKFLRYQLLSSNFLEQVTRDVQGATGSRQRIRTESFEVAKILLPDLEMQRRIVARIEAFLAEVREVNSLQSSIIADTEKLMNACIKEIFDKPNDHWKSGPLSESAFVQTGTAKGRRFGDRVTIEIPYLRVANVQAGYLDLTEIKTIVIASEELKRYKLQVGDLLLTEGGDYDKLGRGAIWEGQVDPCIHQNHVFAVRFDQSKVLPKFAEYEMQSNYAKQYFLSVAKKTTNLASINKTQLSAFPLRYPPSLTEQEQIVTYLETIKREVKEMRHSQQTDKQLIEQLEQAVLTQAFRGEL